MWQKVDDQWHLVMNEVEDRATSACEKEFVPVDHGRKPYVMKGVDNCCPVCFDVWNMCCTSVDAAKQHLRNCENIESVRAAMVWTTSSTLHKALEAKWGKLKRKRDKDQTNMRCSLGGDMRG